MAFDTTEYPSPNFDARSGHAVDMLVIHYTGMWTAQDALERLCHPDAKVSAHYLIDEAGKIYTLVPEINRAWHAGVASWAGEADINSCSIGIELVNKGHDLGYHDFPGSQMAALVSLTQNILTRHPIPGTRMLGHSDVAPARKLDPGTKFDWEHLALAGIGLYPPEGLPKSKEQPERGQFLRKLARFGYAIGADATAGSAAIEAFRRHYHAHAVGSGAIGIGDQTRLDWLLTHLASAV